MNSLDSIVDPLKSSSTIDFNSSEDGSNSPIAMIVYHGMGQQVPFESVDQVVSSLQNHADADVKTTFVDQVKLGDKQYTRTRIRIEPKDTKKYRQTEVDIYECYWAPLTEKQISLKETVQFLIDAGLRGFHFSNSDRPMPRWIFGRIRELVNPANKSLQITALILMLLTIVVWFIKPWEMPILGVKALCIKSGLLLLLYAILTMTLRKTARYLLFALIVFLALIVLNTIIGIVSASLIVHGKPGWPSSRLLDYLTVDLILGLITIVAFAFLGIGIPKLLRKLKITKMPETIRVVFRLFTGLMLASLVITALATIKHCFSIENDTIITKQPIFTYILISINTYHPKWFIIGCIWGSVVLLNNMATSFLVEYLGDVAIYVSGYKTSRFYDIKQKIKDIATDLTYAIYTARCIDINIVGNESNELAYRDITLVGHSLGSVIAYDALNAAIIRNNFNNPIDFAKRTRLLLTFGSPLDKIAFIFRSQGEADGSEIMEAMRTSSQPLINSLSNRPKYWINIWSPDDWISGELNFFDKPMDDTTPPNYRIKRIRNKEDKQAWIPIACHTYYWDNSYLPKLLCNVLTKPKINDIQSITDLPQPGYNDKPPFYAFMRHRDYLKQKKALDNNQEELIEEEQVIEYALSDKNG